MKKVYIVTAGEYSDYRILGAFSSKEAAERACEGRDCDIEEYDLDPRVFNLKGLRKFYGRIDYDGNISNLSTVYKQEDFDDERGFVFLGADAEFGCYAKNEEHAAKIVNEWRREAIANRRWTSDTKKYDRLKDFEMED